MGRAKGTDWKSADSARTRLLRRWGAARLAFVEDVDLEVGLPIYVLPGMAERTRELEAARASLRKIRGQISQLRECEWWLRSQEVGTAIDRLEAAHRDLEQLQRQTVNNRRGATSPPRSPFSGMRPEHIRGCLLREVFARDPSFPLSAADWALFGIVAEFSQPPDDAAAFEALRKGWDEAMKRAGVGRHAIHRRKTGRRA